MSQSILKYPTLLSPITIGSMTARNHMISTLCEPHFVQGNEPFPAESMIAHYANKAKSGVGIVAVGRAEILHDSYETSHFATFNLRNIQAQNMISQCVDAIHFHGAKCEWIVNCPRTPGYDVSGGIPSHYVEGDGTEPTYGEELTKEMILDMVEDYAEQAKILKSCGADMIFMHHAYRMFTPSRFLSSLTNKRTDEFGGPIENRGRFIQMICKRIKEVCGADFPIEISISAFEEEGGTTLEEVIQFAKLMEGYVDVLQLRTPYIDPNHPVGLSPIPYPNLKMDRVFKDAGVKQKITAVGGFFHDFELHEKILAEGTADLIGMARSFISNPDYCNIIYEDRKEDLVPCIKCNRCHTSGVNKPWVSNCSVNPRWGMENRVDSFITPPTRTKKIAIVGGGPAGMETAIEAAKRGHEVTIYEKRDTLGGQLIHADYPDFKYPLKAFKDYLVYHVEKQDNIQVVLNTEVTPEMLIEKGYDEVVMAIGSKPIKPGIPGIDNDNVENALDIYGHAEELDDEIVVIGGGEIGVETGIYLARLNKHVTILEMRKDLALDATPIHYRTIIEDAWKRQENLDYVCEAKVCAITDAGVEYEKSGEKHRVPCGSVVYAVGMMDQQAEAWSFNGVAPRIRLAGDCDSVGNVQTVMRSAYSTGNSL